MLGKLALGGAGSAKHQNAKGLAALAGSSGLDFPVQLLGRGKEAGDTSILKTCLVFLGDLGACLHPCGLKIGRVNTRGCVLFFLLARVIILGSDYISNKPNVSVHPHESAFPPDKQ